MAKAIQDNDLVYNILSPLVQFGCRCHYSSFTVKGKSNLPTDGSYIIAPCHQQALMEPLAVLNIAPKSPVFLARADIFRRPLFRAALTFLKIMPVYRIRDGQDQLGRNREVFDHCRDVLVDGFPLCLMAEGRHNDRHSMLPLRKGMFRIAGEAQQALGERPLYIVPMGIDFDDYERPYSNLAVNIGRPIAVQPFMDCYRDNEPLALNQMRDALAEALSPLMLDIRSEEHYDEIWTLCNLLNRDMRRRKGLGNSAWNRFKMRQEIAHRVEHDLTEEEERERLLERSAKVKEGCARLHLEAADLAEHWNLATTLMATVAIMLLLAAVAIVPVLRRAVLFCLLCYPMALLPTHLLVKRKIKDPQFRSSVNFGVRFFGSILYTIVISIALAATRGLLWGLAAVAVVHIMAWLIGPTVGVLRRTMHSCRYWLARLVHRKAMRALDAEKQEIETGF